MSRNGTHLATVNLLPGQGKGRALIIAMISDCQCCCVILQDYKNKNIVVRFNEILDRFMETFVAPRMAAVEGGEVAEVSKQIYTS